MKYSIKILKSKLLPKECIHWVSSNETGGINIFIGTVRNHSNGRDVVKLEFEAYEKMALNEMQRIADEACKRWKVIKILIHHRVGTLEIGEIPVIIAVSSIHRNESFEVCKFIIDQLKKTVPIWKKEHYTDGQIWVAAHP